MNELSNVNQNSSFSDTAYSSCNLPGFFILSIKIRMISVIHAFTMPEGFF